MAASAPVRSARPGGAPPRRSAPKTPLWRAALSGLPPRAYAGACLAAIAVTIVANAAFFQHRAAPPAAQSEIAPAVARAVAPVPAAEAPQRATPATVLPPARPASPAKAAAPVNDDPIADLLRGNGATAAKEDKKLIIAAQSALIKLGYVVKADGDANAATLQAVADYEKRHALPVTQTINAHVVKILNAAVANGN